MHIIHVSSLCTSKGQPCCTVLSLLTFSLFGVSDHMTEQSRCDKTRACRTCFVDSVLKKVEQCFNMDSILILLYQYILIMTVQG